MPEQPTQRRFPRYTIVLPFLYEADASGSTSTGVGWTSNLSEGGACLELNEQLALATLLLLVLRTAEEEIELKAQVVWSAPVGGTERGFFHGVNFVAVPPDARRALRELLRTKGQVRNAGVRLPMELTVLCRRKGEPGESMRGRTGDISRAGMLLRLPRAIAAGTALEVTMQTSQGPLTAEGIVVWVRAAEGPAAGALIRHGFKFTNLSWTSELALGHLLAGRL